jgi:hypothetical protein
VRCVCGGGERWFLSTAEPAQPQRPAVCKGCDVHPGTVDWDELPYFLRVTRKGKQAPRRGSLTAALQCEVSCTHTHPPSDTIPPSVGRLQIVWG